MKKIVFLTFSIIILLSINCSNSTDTKTEKGLLSVTMKNTEVYKYKTGIGGDEEGASIIKQANHFEISDITRNNETNWEAVYKYKPAVGFIGIDNVELELSTGSDGASRPTHIEIIRIEFIIN